MKSVLVSVNGAAMPLVAAMSDLTVSTRLTIVAVAALNVALLIGQRALLTRPARWGAMASLAGYAGTVVFWLVLALGCGIEYFNQQCDAVVTPLIAAAVIVSLIALPIGRLGAALLRS